MYFQDCSSQESSQCDGESFNPPRTSTQTRGSRGRGATQESGAAATQSQIIYDSHQCLCGYDGALADHLRTSAVCVQTLRQDPALEMGGNEEQFIVKATLLLKGCPAPSCPGLNGGHSKEDLPHQTIRSAAEMKK